MALGIFVGIPFTRWMFESVGRDTFRTWKEPLSVVMAIPAIATSVLTFYLGSRVLRRAGIYVDREERWSHKLAAQGLPHRGGANGIEHPKPRTEQFP